MFYMHAPQQTQNISIAFIQRRPNVFDIVPTLYEWYTNVLCLLGGPPQSPLGLADLND